MRGPQPWRTQRARVLRANDTSAEAKLWAELRNRRLGGHKFVRQAAIAQVFVDFLCRERRLVVEVDGGTHGTDSELAADRVRDDTLKSLGYRVFRVGNTDVYDNIDGVLGELLALIESGL